MKATNLILGAIPVLVGVFASFTRADVEHHQGLSRCLAHIYDPDKLCPCVNCLDIACPPGGTFCQNPCDDRRCECCRGSVPVKKPWTGQHGETDS